MARQPWCKNANTKQDQNTACNTLASTTSKKHKDAQSTFGRNILQPHTYSQLSDKALSTDVEHCLSYRCNICSVQTHIAQPKIQQERVLAKSTNPPSLTSERVCQSRQPHVSENSFAKIRERQETNGRKQEMRNIS